MKRILPFLMVIVNLMSIDANGRGFGAFGGSRGDFSGGFGGGFYGGGGGRFSVSNTSPLITKKFDGVYKTPSDVLYSEIPESKKLQFLFRISY